MHDIKAALKKKRLDQKPSLNLLHKFKIGLNCATAADNPNYDYQKNMEKSKVAIESQKKGTYTI
jgi:hypothetical protein